jgi:hypothetical protein
VLNETERNLELSEVKGRVKEVERKTARRNKKGRMITFLCKEPLLIFFVSNKFPSKDLRLHVSFYTNS